MKRLSALLFSIFALANVFAAVDSTQIATVVPTAVTPAAQKAMTLWYSPEIELHGRQASYFDVPYTCPPNTGNVFCSLVKVKTDKNSCPLTRIQIESWFDVSNPHRVIVVGDMRRNGAMCSDQNVDSTVSCTVICAIQ